MRFTCPNCQSINEHQISFSVVEYVCNQCSHLIDVARNTSKKKVITNASNIVLDLNSKGIIDGTEYFVVGIVVRRYSELIYWREYFLKDKDNNDAFLSEIDGHWVFLQPTGKEFIEHGRYCDHDGKLYRLYETTPSSLFAAKGFFEEKLNFNVVQYKEYVNGERMVSWEQSGNTRQYLEGRHISKYDVKKLFQPKFMPNYEGIGIVQPYYFDHKAAVLILGIIAIIIALFQYMFTSPRKNEVVYTDTISFLEVKDSEKKSPSFVLDGISAPLKVELESNVENSWANVEVSLINESNNEVIYTNKDIELYSGIEDGETWYEGSQRTEYNICGVSPGRYHLLIKGDKEHSVAVKKIDLYHPDNLVRYEETVGSDYIDKITVQTGENVALYLPNLEKNDPYEYKRLQEARIYTASNPNLFEAVDLDTNKSFAVRVIWLPVSYWNFGIVISVLVVLGFTIYIGRYYFEKSKWNNSGNSPY